MKGGRAAPRRAAALLLLGVIVALGVWWARRAWVSNQRDTTSAIVRVQSASLAASQGEYAAAICECREVLAQDSGAADAYRVMGYACYRLKRYPEARVALEKAVAARPDDAFAACFLGLTYAERPGDADEQDRARALLARSAAGYRGAEPWYGLGLLALRQGRVEEALVHLRQAVRTDPGWESGHYRLAEAYRRAGRSVEARREALLFDRLKKTRPEFERLLSELARVPNANQTRFRLARLCLATGRYREALEHYRLLADRTRSPRALQGVAAAAAALDERDLAARARQAVQAASRR